MRRVSSYGPVNDKLHYYAPRKELIERVYTQLMGESPDEGGHYITVWAPRQADMKIFEAVYHFNLYSYLKHFLGVEGGSVNPEFPTGNGKIDLILSFGGKRYGVEVKSFTTRGNYTHALVQAAQYGKQLGLAEIFLAFFVDGIDDENRARLEKEYRDDATGVRAVPSFVQVGGEE